MSQDVKQLIEELMEHVESGNYFQLLGVPQSADQVTVTAAYRRLARSLHPDKLDRLDLGPLMHDGDLVFRAVNQAYVVLSNPDKRRAHLDRLADGSVAKGVRAAAAGPAAAGRDPALDIDAALDIEPESLNMERRKALAELLHQRGATLFGQGRFEDAERHFAKAKALAPDKPLYSLKLGWTIFKNPTRQPAERLSEARPHLEHAAARDAYNGDARYCMAAYWREVGKDDFYKRELEAVLRCQPAHRRAADELTELKKRNEASRSRGASGIRRRRSSRFGLSRLFGRE